VPEEKEVAEMEEETLEDETSEEEDAEEAVENGVDFPSYEEIAEDIKDLQAMQKTAAYMRLIKRIRNKIVDSTKDLLDLEKTREIINAQESVKVLHWVLDVLKEPVMKLRGFIEANPLMAPADHIDAHWDNETEMVVIDE
jgi:hypothetical protein